MMCNHVHLLFSIEVPGTVGPMARDVESLALCMKALLCDDMFQLDPFVPPVFFNEEVHKRLHCELFSVWECFR